MSNNQYPYNASDLYMVAYRAARRIDELTTIRDIDKVARDVVAEYLRQIGHAVPSYIVPAN